MLPRSARLASVVLASTLLAACGASAPREEGELVASATSGASATSVADEPPDPRHLCAGACAPGDACPSASIEWRCECEAHEDVNCGGAERELRPPTWLWACTPIDPRTDRGDGCPLREPEGGACAASVTCRYQLDACGRETAVWSCLGGQWTPIERISLPPPP